MRRANLQANDLLDIVDFIKNEEKYIARINELKEQEASLDAKLEIVNTLEAAEIEERKYRDLQVRLKQEQEVIFGQYEMLTAKLKKEHQDRLNLVNERESELRKLRSQLGEKQEELKQTAEEQAGNAALLRQRDTFLTNRENKINIEETNWRNKIAQLNQILGL